MKMISPFALPNPLPGISFFKRKERLGLEIGVYGVIYLEGTSQFLLLGFFRTRGEKDADPSEESESLPHSHQAPKDSLASGLLI